MNSGTRYYDLVCDNYEDGLNTVLKSSEVARQYQARTPFKQCVRCLNVTLHNNKRRLAVKGFATLTGRLFGLGTYLRVSGDTDVLLAARGRALSMINKADGTETQLYEWVSSGEAWFDTYADKAWVSNGVKVLKVEGSTALQVGISPPEGVIAAASAGGTLPDGVYKIFVSYARRDATLDVNLLYSTGQSVGDVTLGSGNNSIAFSGFLNSDDPQVGNKIVWMTDADDSTYYQYYQTKDNVTEAFTITDDSQKVTSLVYSVLAINNDVPPAFEYIKAHDRRIWGSVGDTLYLSLQYGSPYDLERFDTTNNFIRYPFQILGIFNVGADLYVNTPGGLIRQPFSDPSARYEIVGSNTGRPLYFKYPRTVADWEGSLIGLTNDGVRIFDGQSWSADLTKDIRTDVQRIAAGFSSSKQPCGAVRRTSTRMEYHLSYYDPQVSESMNNRRLVLNMDRIQFFNTGEVRAPWDQHTNGAHYMVLDSSETLFSGQANNDTSIIYKDRTDRMVDANVYIEDELTTSAVPKVLIRSGTFIPDIRGFVRLIQTRVLAAFTKDFYVRFQIVSRVTADALSTFEPNLSGFQLNVSQLGVDRFSSSEPILDKVGLPRTLKGPAFYVEITQTLEDKKFELLELTVLGVLVRSRKT